SVLPLNCQNLTWIEESRPFLALPPVHDFSFRAKAGVIRLLSHGQGSVMDTGRGTTDDPGAKLKLLEQELARSRSDLDASQKVSARLTEENETLRIHADRRQWEAGFRLATDTTPGLIWFGGADGSVEFLNTQWCAYTGLTMQEGLGWNWISVIHPEDLPGLVEHWGEIIKSARPDEHEARMRRSDGAYRWFLLRCAPLLDESGAVIRWYGTNTDIEERKRVEQALSASENLSRGQVEALKSTLDALAMEPAADKLVEHVLRIITEQFGAHSISVWRLDLGSGMIGIEMAFEDGRVVTSADPRFAGIDKWLPMEERWPWPEVFRTSKPSLIEDIRAVPAFALRDRLLPMGIITVLLVPMFVAGRLEGAIGIRFVEKKVFGAEEMDLAQALANQVMLMIQFARLSTQTRETAVIAERNRIARDIHDTLAQGLTGVIVQLEAAEDANLRGLSREAGEHLDRARRLARESLNEARRSVHALRPQVLDDSNLSGALAELFTKMTEGTSLKMEFAVLGAPRSLPPNSEENLFRIGQEILTNALRHAQAKLFTAKLIFLPGEVCLDLHDDGRGFDPSSKNDGYGLLGIRERVERIGGQLVVQSSPAKGTAVRITLPSQEA
ncbi:histidine kinase, partial [Mesorhizobium sp.]|uniref:sensor histidine kinase n=2 Tax=Mesorhizobium sp. TaxID=1871066 RepID=UPI0025BA65DF